jgi:hypothetical protein
VAKERKGTKSRPGMPAAPYLCALMIAMDRCHFE